MFQISLRSSQEDVCRREQLCSEATKVIDGSSSSRHGLLVAQMIRRSLSDDVKRVQQSLSPAGK
jgi:hypothetical protein